MLAIYNAKWQPAVKRNEPFSLHLHLQRCGGRCHQQQRKSKRVKLACILFWAF